MLSGRHSAQRSGQSPPASPLRQRRSDHHAPGDVAPLNGVREYIAHDGRRVCGRHGALVRRPTLVGVTRNTTSCGFAKREGVYRLIAVLAIKLRAPTMAWKAGGAHMACAEEASLNAGRPWCPSPQSRLAGAACRDQRASRRTGSASRTHARVRQCSRSRPTGRRR